VYVGSRDMKRIVLGVGVLSALLTAKAHAETGLASHYGHGDGFHGLRTASGERFNKMAMTAAHRNQTHGHPCHGDEFGKWTKRRGAYQ
jgi:rare lipoprotein A